MEVKKLYYSIREVSDLLDEEQHILRYWEKEFKSLKPKKNSAGNRKYSQKDIEVLNKIKSLLRDKKFPLIEAKDLVDNNKDIPSNGRSQTDLFPSSKKSKETKKEKSGLNNETIQDLVDVLKDISKLLKS